MRWTILIVAACLSACASNSQNMPPETASPSASGAGPLPGATAGSSTQGGVLGSGTADSPAGAK